MPDISKIKVDNKEYNIKDSELRRMIDILLGIENPDDFESEKQKDEISNDI